MSLLIKITGERACFSNPELPIEKFSYPVISPSCAKNCLESIYWKPEMAYVIEKIVVYNEPSYSSIKINGTTISGLNSIPGNLHDDLTQFGFEKRRQVNITFLRNVEYIVEVSIKLVGEETEENNLIKHYEMLKRRIAKGQCYRQPFLGMKRFPANLELVETIPDSQVKNFYIGRMEYEFDYKSKKTIMYVPKMENGIIVVPQRNNLKI